MKPILAIFIVLLFSPSVPLRASGEGKPNILFILSDDHALEAIGAYDSWLQEYVATPTLDRLAAEGMRFDNLCVNNSICSPSRASILTGQYSHKNGVRRLNGSIHADSPMVSEELKKAGYQVAVFGKWHLRGPMRGFDAWAITRGQGSYFDPVLETAEGRLKLRGYSTDAFTDLALDWLEQRDKSRPFALSVHFKGAHHPYDYPERHSALLEGVKVPEPPTLHEDVETSSPRLKARLPQQMSRNASYYERHRKDEEPRMGPAEADRRSQASAAYQHMIHKYLRCVAAIDDNVQRLVDRLDSEGILDDTLILYSSDQGYWLGQHGLYDKRLILEESLKMPLIVRFPRLIEGGKVDRHLCSNVDFAPTLLELAGVPVPSAMQGRSLLPLLRGDAPDDWRRAAWYAYWDGPAHWGIRTSDDKTLVRFPGTEEIEFYDMQKDPLQQRSLHGDPACAEGIAAARVLLEETMREVDIQSSDLPSGGKQAKRQARKNRDGPGE